MSKLLSLPMITLIAMDTVDPSKAVKALEYSCKDIDFGEVVLVSHVKPDNCPDFIRWEYTSKCDSVDEWSRKAIYDMPQYIKTDYCLLIHADGYVVNAESFDYKFLDYDYIGAAWQLPQDDFSYRDINGNIVRVGNSVSIRSKKLLDLANKLNLPWESFHGYWNEDGYICAAKRHIYEAAGCKFAPVELAVHFSHEVPIPEMEGIDKPFCFHKHHHGKNNQYLAF